MITRRRFLYTVPAALVAGSQPAGAQPRPAITGVWMGGVTPQGVTVTVLTSAPDVPVTLTMPAGASPALEQTVPANADGVAVFVLTGLASRTRYRYAVSAAGGAALDGSFRTFGDGPFSFRLLFASCASTGSSNPVFTAMRQLQPDLFVHLGDLHYENISRPDVLQFRKAYTRVLASTTQGPLYRSVPIAYVWDDHDYGPNNSDRRSPSRPAAWQAYRRFVPHYPLAEPANGPVHHAFSIGRARMLVTDTRSERSPDSLAEPQRTMLGSSQLAWLERELAAAASAPLVILVNTVPWITKRNESTTDGWARYARERRHIADLIVRHGLTRKLVMLSGDGHMLAMDDGTNSQYSTLPETPPRGFVIAHAAPMDRRPTNKGGPHSHGQVAKNNQFGVMDVTDEGGTISVRLRGMRLGAPVPGMEMEFTV